MFFIILVIACQIKRFFSLARLDQGLQTSGFGLLNYFNPDLTKAEYGRIK